jgi:Family of unknown function (DUF6247)
MAATATTSRVPYATASPAELREAILPEDVPSFDEQYRAALNAAAETLRLDELEKFLAQWRRIAWSANAKGHDTWRALLAEAERRRATASREGVSMEEMEQRIAARLAGQ